MTESWEEAAARQRKINQDAARRKRQGPTEKFWRWTYDTSGLKTAATPPPPKTVADMILAEARKTNYYLRSISMCATFGFLWLVCKLLYWVWVAINVVSTMPIEQP